MNSKNLKELPPPIGDFILAQTDIEPGIVESEHKIVWQKSKDEILYSAGSVFHYSQVCQLLNRLNEKNLNEKKEKEKEESLMIFYAVRSKDGKFFRAKGYNHYSGRSNGSGTSWVDTFEKAKIYTRPGPAKTCVSWWVKNYPNYGAPEVVELHITNVSVFDEARHKELLKQKKKKKQPKLQNDFFKLKI